MKPTLRSTPTRRRSKRCSGEELAPGSAPRQRAHHRRQASPDRALPAALPRTAGRVKWLLAIWARDHVAVIGLKRAVRSPRRARAVETGCDSEFLATIWRPKVRGSGD